MTFNLQALSVQAPYYSLVGCYHVAVFLSMPPGDLINDETPLHSACGGNGDIVYPRDLVRAQCGDYGMVTELSTRYAYPSICSSWVCVADLLYTSSYSANYSSSVLILPANFFCEM